MSLGPMIKNATLALCVWMLATLGSSLGNKPLMIHLATNSQPLLLVGGGGWPSSL